MEISELYDRLEAYGADMKGISGRFLDEKEFYKECLDDFLKEPSFKGLDEALGNGDYANAFSCAHSLKGVSANLGLLPFYDVICPLVESLRNQKYQNVADEYARVREQIRSIEELIR